MGEQQLELQKHSLQILQLDHCPVKAIRNLVGSMILVRVRTVKKLKLSKKVAPE